jgi:hypothetical protein
MASKKKIEVDFSDEEAVLAEMERELDNNRLIINEDKGLSSFSTGTVYRVESGNKEWMVVENSDQERELALAIVTQDLDDSPENFTQSWLEGFINIDRLRRDLHSDVFDMNYTSLEEMSEKEIVRLAEQYGIDQPDEDTDEDAASQFEWDLDELAEKMTEEQLKDPMSYLDDIGGDAVKKAIEIAGIDIDAAAEDAVNTDGPGHFLSSYDGNTSETKGGLVYWRTN